MSRRLVLLFFGAATTAWFVAFTTRTPLVAGVAFLLSAGAVALQLRSSRTEAQEAIPSLEPDADAECESDPALVAARHVPVTLEPASVVRALLEAARETGNAVAAHLWIRDESSGGLRLVAAEGALGPGVAPLRHADEVIQGVAARGEAVVAPVSRVTTPNGTSTVWRYAVPLTYNSLSGVAGVDFATESEPDCTAINRVAAGMRFPLVCALGMHVADGRTTAARSLLDATRELSRSLDPDDVIRAALGRAMTLASAATGSVMLLERDSGRLSIAAAEGLPAEVVRLTSTSVGEGIAGWVAASGQPLLVEDLPGRSGRGQRHGVRSALSVPIADEEGLLGVLNVGSRAYPATFTDGHMEALEILGRQTAVALRNARAVVLTQSLYLDTLKALALAMETKDPYATGGTERIMDLTAALGKAMGLSDEDQQALELAGVLHDIGMAAIVDAGAGSPRPLSTVERGLLKMHPSIAAEILESIPALRHVTPIVYHHHEHFDGGGYASGVSGDQIPFGARILAVADAYVAMTSDRPYRRAMTQEVALAELREKSGTQFDPGVVQAIERLLGSGSERVPDRTI